MKVLHINHSDQIGGAARATFRIHGSLRTIGVDSRMRVIQATSQDWTVAGPKNKLEKFKSTLKAYAGALIAKSAISENKSLHSPSFFSSISSSEINNDSADIINLHWVAKETISISEIPLIQKPLVWTLHDMWAFCGAEHITEDARWSEGYWRENRPLTDAGVDLNRLTWARKRKLWKKPIHIITPSVWLGECVKNSKLLGDWPVTVIPNPIDTSKWCPVEMAEARALLDLSLNKKYVLFGAINGTGEKNKGFAHLEETLSILRDCHKVDDLELIILGERAPEFPKYFGFPVHYCGHLHDDISLRILFSAVDVVVIPSRVENFPNVALEAQACGTPVVAFNVGGLVDIVSHCETGYLAHPYDAADLALGVSWIIGHNNINCVREKARVKVRDNFNYQLIACRYHKIYREIIEAHS